MTEPIMHKLWYMNFFAGKTRCGIRLPPVLSAECSWVMDWDEVTCTDCLHTIPKKEREKEKKERRERSMKKLITLARPIHISDTVAKEIDAVVLEVISADDVAFYGTTRRVHSAKSGVWINIQEIGALSVGQSNIAGLEHLDGISSAKESEK